MSRENIEDELFVRVTTVPDENLVNLVFTTPMPAFAVTRGDEG
jgi:hypothetical protein